jgi:hypothetical protein
LEGAPEYVGSDFYCSNCKQLTTLNGSPNYVGGNYDCSRCDKLKSSEGVSPVKKSLYLPKHLLPKTEDSTVTNSHIKMIR